VTAALTIAVEVAKAIDELTASFDAPPRVMADRDGGAWVVLDGVDLGSRWSPRTTWLGFHIASTYPYADVYPHFIDAGCKLAATGILPAAVTPGAQMPGQGACLQISRRSNRWDPTRDSAALKALKVIAWLRSS
jgi:hypothetical protein